MDPTDVQARSTMGQVLCAEQPAICERAADASSANTTNRNLGAYIQDSWQIRPNFTINAGIRWEQQIGYVAESLQGPDDARRRDRSGRRLQRSTTCGRRASASSTTRRKEGQSKSSATGASSTRTFRWTCNVRVVRWRAHELHVSTSTAARRRQPGYDPNCDVDHTAGRRRSSTRLNMCQDRSQLAVLGRWPRRVRVARACKRSVHRRNRPRHRVRDHARPQVRHQLHHRTLPSNVIEDVSTDGGNNYLITNPGKNFDAEADALHEQAQTLMASSESEAGQRSALSTSRARSRSSPRQELRAADPQLRRRAVLRRRSARRSARCSWRRTRTRSRRVTTRVSSRRRPASPTRTSRRCTTSRTCMANRYGFARSRSSAQPQGRRVLPVRPEEGGRR